MDKIKFEILEKASRLAYESRKSETLIVEGECLSVNLYDKSLIVILKSEHGSILAHSTSATSSIHKTVCGIFSFYEDSIRYKIQLELLTQFLPKDFEPAMVCGDIIGITRL